MCRPFIDSGCKINSFKKVTIDCDFWDVPCNAHAAFQSVMHDLSAQIIEGTRKVLASVGTMWLNTPPIDVKNSGSDPIPVGVHAGEHAPGVIDGVDPVNSVMGWIMWIALGICVLSLIIAGARMAWHARSGDSQQHTDRIGTILFATILISGGVGLVSGVLRPGDSMGSTGVAFIQNSTWWYTVAFGALGVIFGGVKMAWDQRADAGKDLVRSLLTLLVISGIGLSVISYLQFAGDEFSKWIIGKSLECEVRVDGVCLADKMIGLLISDEISATMGLLMAIVFGILALLISLIQVVLLIIRNGLLVVLSGMFPLSAAATNTTSGKQMFNKVTGWIIGFLLYKPVAAIIYAAAFKLAQGNSGDIILSILTGITLMVMSLLALPAMMTLIVPAVGNVTGGGGGAAAGVAAAALPTGAMVLSKGNSGGSGGAGKGPSGAAGGAAGGGAGPKGPSGNNAPASGGNSGGAGTGSSSNGRPQGAQGGARGSSISGGGSGDSSSGSSGGSPSGAAGSGGHGGGSPAVSGGAGGSTSGGGPSGAESSSAGGGNNSAAAAMMAAQAGIQAAQSEADEATGAGGGPDGSQQ